MRRFIKIGLGLVIFLGGFGLGESAFAQRGRGGARPVSRTPSPSRPAAAPRMAAPAARATPRPSAPSRPSFSNVGRAPAFNTPRPSQGAIGRPNLAPRANLPQQPRVNTPQRPNGFGSVPNMTRPGVPNRSAFGNVSGVPNRSMPGTTRSLTGYPSYGRPGSTLPPYVMPNRPGAGAGVTSRPGTPRSPFPPSGSTGTGGRTVVGNRQAIQGNNANPVIGGTRNNIIGNTGNNVGNTRNRIDNTVNNTNITRNRIENINNFSTTNNRFGPGRGTVIGSGHHPGGQGFGGSGHWGNGNWGHNGNWSHNGNWGNHWAGNWGRGGHWGGNWGGGWNGWGNQWRNCFVNSHNWGWYNGCWNNGFVGSDWGLPVVGAALGGWGFGALPYASGYCDYYNPYCASVGVPVGVPLLDYSQPLFINSYLSPAATDIVDQTVELGADVVQQPVNPPTVQAGFREFDQARAVFTAGDYRESLRLADAALQAVPGDPTMHEFRALVLFALKDYREAAATLNAFLAVAPGWDWTTMIGLYPNVDVYTAQLRALEAFRREHPEAADARFVLAYQYTVAGHKDAAARELRQVVQMQPKDQVAARLLRELSPDTADAGAVAQVQQPAAPGQATDLTGTWRAKRDDGSEFELAITANGKFQWKFLKGKQGKDIEGTYTVGDDVLSLESKKDGTMVAQVTSQGPDRFTYRLTNGPPNDAGLVFIRVK